MEIRINEAFEDYQPPFNATKVVRKLLATVPSKYLLSLDCIVLTNQGALSRKQRIGKIRSRKKRVPAARVRGLYHGKWLGKPAWIEIRVDKSIESVRKPWIWIPLVQEFCLGQVLYHEIGHHIHSTAVPEFKEKEDVADNWRDKFNRSFYKTNYRLLIWPARIIWKIRGVYRRVTAASNPSR